VTVGVCESVRVIVGLRTIVRLRVGAGVLVTDSDSVGVHDGAMTTTVMLIGYETLPSQLTA
jgi:hypothetical protein